MYLLHLSGILHDLTYPGPRVYVPPAYIGVPAFSCPLEMLCFHKTPMLVLAMCHDPSQPGTVFESVGWPTLCAA
jgi:hypothetical protein